MNRQDEPTLPRPPNAQPVEQGERNQWWIYRQRSEPDVPSSYAVTSLDPETFSAHYGDRFVFIEVGTTASALSRAGDAA